MTALTYLRRSVTRRAFSVGELAVVVAVIAIIAAVAIPIFLGQREGAQDAQAKSHVRNVASVARAAAANNGGLYPPLEQIAPDEPSVRIVTDPSTNPFEVSGMIESGQSAKFAALSKSGTCWILNTPLNAKATWEHFDAAETGKPCGGVLLAGELILKAVIYNPEDETLELEWEPDPEAEGYEVCVEDSGCVTVSGTSWSGNTGGKGVTVRSIRSGKTGPGTSYRPSTGSGGGSGGSSGGGSTPPPPPPVDDEGSGGEFTVEQVGNTVRLTFVDTGTGADSYEIRRCITAGCTDGAAIATIPSDGPGEYTYDDDVTTLIENGVEVARYQVVAFKDIYGTASNWAEVHLVPQAPEGTWLTITAGAAHTCGITTTGTAYCWGRNTSGQLGNGSTGGSYNTPQLVADGELTFKAISAGLDHTCGITDTGTAYCWGNNGSGRLGNGNTSNAHTPHPVSGGHKWQTLSGGFNHTCGITTTGKAYCWGNNGSGRLGNGSAGGSYNTPQLVADGELTFKAITAGTEHTCGITDTGTAYCWGKNTFGQLGIGNTSNADTPQPVADGELTFKAITAGTEHTCGITDTGTAYCWGNNGPGRLGNGSAGGSYNTPWPVADEGVE